MRHSRWLHDFESNITTTDGEDGIIAKALEVIGASDLWCVEFGASDGKWQSNTFNLIRNKGYSAILIEADGGKFRELLDTYQDAPNVTALQKFIHTTGENSVDSLLSRTPIPADFDLLSIDIDGNDYHVWESIRIYRPKLVIIEFNPTIPNAVEFVQPSNHRLNQMSSIRSMVLLGKSKGYELIAATRANAFFVATEYFSLFEMADNSIDAIRTDASLITYIFHGMDGTVFMRGYGRLFWHNLPLRVPQPLPAFLRRFPSHYNFIQKWCLGFIKILLLIPKLLTPRRRKSATPE